jgi:aminopeptidase
MFDPRLDKLAELIVSYSVAIRPGDKVLLQGSSLAEPLLKRLYIRILQAGGLPFSMIMLPGMDELVYRHASDAQLQFVPDALRLMIETYDVRIGLLAADNTRALSGVDPARMVLRDRAFAGINSTFLKRAAEGKLRWTLAPYPTAAFAQDAEMSLTEYEDFVFRACMPDADDPVGYWRGVSARQQRLVDWLAGKKAVHVRAKETDLRLSIEGRTFINCDCKENIPDGEIFTGPVETSVEGCVYFSYPAIFGGREVDGVRLWFEQGRVVKAAAEKNEGFLLQTLDTDEGARRLGEFAIGTNEGITRFTREILFDEKISGSFHMALGEGYPESGSVNESAIHWDMICDLRSGGEITVDGTPFYRDGRFLIQP